jgi:hypothetical protein
MAYKQSDEKSVTQTGTTAGAMGQPQEAQARDPYQMGPSSYIPMSRYEESNKAASEATAKRLGQQVSGEAAQAQDALQREYGQFSQQADRGSAGYGAYTGPAEYSPSDAVRQQYLKAQHDLTALGSEEGVQQLLGPKGSMFGARLAYRSGADRPLMTRRNVKPTYGQSEFGELQGRYAGLGGELQAAQQQAREEVAGRKFAAEVEANKKLADKTKEEEPLRQKQAAQAREEMQHRADYENYMQGGWRDWFGSQPKMSYADWRANNNLPPLSDESEGT